MKVLMICGVFGVEYIEFIKNNSKRQIEYSANTFQTKLINGFSKTECDFSVISAPFIGSYPNYSKAARFVPDKNSTKNNSTVSYVAFNNFWGIRNFSRSYSIKKSIIDFAKDPECDKKIVVYSAHTPFLDAAVYAKKIDPRIKITLVVPDLPQYMVFDKKINLLYRIGKKIDIAKFDKLNKFVDSYVLLTDAMKDMLEIQNRPYFVAEGIVDENDFSNASSPAIDTYSNEKYIVYTGKLNEKFGVKTLVDEFSQMPQNNLRLILCGKGDLEDYIRKVASKDDRIRYMGQVAPDIAKNWMNKATVLVNPRPNNEEYTKYSFPSKNIEYLLTGKPVVAYMLDGMDAIYKNFIFEVCNDDLVTSINNALESKYSNKQFIDYAHLNLSSYVLANKIISL